MRLYTGMSTYAYFCRSFNSINRNNNLKLKNSKIKRKTSHRSSKQQQWHRGCSKRKRRWCWSAVSQTTHAFDSYTLVWTVHAVLRSSDSFEWTNRMYLFPVWKLRGNGNERTNHTCELVPTTNQIYKVHKNSFAKRKRNDEYEREKANKRSRRRKKEIQMHTKRDEKKKKLIKIYEKNT